MLEWEILEVVAREEALGNGELLEADIGGSARSWVIDDLP